MKELTLHSCSWLPSHCLIFLHVS